MPLEFNENGHPVVIRREMMRNEIRVQERPWITS